MVAARLLLAAALTLVASVAAPIDHAAATTVAALGLRELVADAELVLVGTATDSRVSWDHLGRIVTDTTVRVDERMHGTPGTRVVLRSLGGVLDGVGLAVPGETNVAPGERILLFARRVVADDVVRPVGMSQGVMPIVGSATGDVVMPGGGGLALVQRGSDGRLRAAPGALLAPTAADALLEQVRSLIGEVHGR